MTDELERASSAPISPDRVQRIIDEQLRVMEKQLSLMKALAATVAQPADTTTPDSPPPTDQYPKRVPLTDVQRDVWITCQLSSEGSAAYNLATLLHLQGDLDVGALQESLRHLAIRHESLRTTFDPSGDYQLVGRTAELELPLVDLSDGPETERASQFEALLDEEKSTPYDLINGPLCRPRLMKLGDEDHVLLLSAHHLISDGWSLRVMRRDLGAIYGALISGRDVPLAEATQYHEFVEWRVEESRLSKPYWMELYREPPAQLDLPTDHARPAVQSFDFAFERTVLDEDLLASVRTLAVAQGVTVFNVLLAGWEILLHRLSGQRTFANGVFVAGQPAMGTRELVGLCTNVLATRVDIDPDMPLSDYLRASKRVTTDAIDNQCFSVGQLASELSLTRDPSRPAVVSSVVTMESALPEIDFGGLQASGRDHGRRRYGSFDLELYLMESPTDLTADLMFSRAIFEPETIRRWLGHYAVLLEQMTAHPDAPVSELQLLGPAERTELRTRWNATDAEIPDRSTHERFEDQVARQPQSDAVTTSDGSLTYAELNARANRLARHLRDLGVGEDSLVGVHLERAPDMLVALLAVHKAGGAYVPLDPLFPDERLAMIASDAGLAVLVTQASLEGMVVAEDAAAVVLDKDRPTIDALDASNLGVTLSQDALAYVIYTSGSTGRPKGVEVPHIALTNFLESMRLRPGLAPDDVLLAVTTMSFDIAGLEFFLPLITGATLVLADEQQAVDAIWLRERLAEGDITVMQATPATWQLLLDAGWSGTTGLKVLCGGEALSQELAAALGSRVGSLWNMYGPTETTIWSSVSEVDADGGPVRIGSPIHNTDLHVLDRDDALQPLGVPGELCIGGVGLARGYRNRPDLTAERFFSTDLGNQQPSRLYRTGDVVRRSADGEIEYIGRADFQVKIRGFRIELGEIETVLAQHPAVKACAVVARDADDGSKRLVGYVISGVERPPSVSDIRAFLRQTLPEYMVPAVFVFLDAFPLTANKKVDRAKLPDPRGQRPDLGTEFVEPSTEREALLASIWVELLGVEQVGVHDNFFDLGGDSLLALRCIMQANRAGISLTPISLFRHQTIAELTLAASAGADSGTDEQGTVTGPTPLTPAQLRFLNERETPDAHHWNVSTIVKADRFSATALKTAVGAVVRHHDALRLRLWREDGRYHQEISAPTGDIPFESHDVASLHGDARAAEIERVCARLQESIDLERGLMLRVAHFDCGPNEMDRLFVTIHHFAVDGLTREVFWEDLEQAYRQADGGSAVSLPPKTTSIQAWTRHLEHLTQSPRVVETASVWEDRPWHEVAPLPRDHDANDGANTNSSATNAEVEFSQEETRLLLGGPVRPEYLIITALARSLSAWTGSPTVLLDILSHGRSDELEGVNLSRTVGFTLSYNPLLLSHPTLDGTSDNVASVVSQIEAQPEGFTFELLRFLAASPELRDRLDALPRADVLFNYAGVDATDGDGLPWEKASEPTGLSVSLRGLRQYPLAVRAALVPNLRLSFVYSTRLHNQATIEARVVEVEAALRGFLGQSAVKV